MTGTRGTRTGARVGGGSAADVDGRAVSDGIAVPAKGPLDDGEPHPSSARATIAEASPREATETSAIRQRYRTSLMAPQDFPGGRFAIVTDPQGAAFGMLQMAPR